ncbi:hypothetical protein DB30_05942 [Enhygromyxa salina]|uniref:Uncharacterized protein n=1 Tax=Enhygromyxa salina TaxID=215803 RepID=A0A0C2A6M6_9BACT|nr:hypothetical protein DB30_05942 [Enhygromyxa salina]
MLLSTAALVFTLASGCDLGDPVDSADSGNSGNSVGGADSPTRDAEPRPLVYAEDWTPTAAADDPLFEHRPSQTICPSSAWAEEFGTLEVSTSGCNYFSVEQPLAEPLEIGDELRVRVWWQSLISHEPATGHLALLINGALVWETHVEIPGASDARSIRFASPVAAEPGATVTFHLHNHGANTWTLAEFATLGQPDQVTQ